MCMDVLPKPNNNNNSKETINVCLFITCMPDDQGVQKKASDPLELNRGLCVSETEPRSTTEPSFQPLFFLNFSFSSFSVCMFKCVHMCSCWGIAHLYLFERGSLTAFVLLPSEPWRCPCSQFPNPKRQMCTHSLDFPHGF